MNWWREHGGKIIFGVTLVIIAIELAFAWVTKTWNQGLGMIIITTTLTGITMYYSWLNRRLLETTNSPKIVLYIRPWRRYEQQEHMLVIENIGTGTASDIRLEVLNDAVFMLGSELSLADMPCARGAIKSMPPKQDYKALIKSTELDEQQKKQSYKIKVCYKNWQDKEDSEVFNLSIEATHDYLQDDLVSEYLKEIATHTKEIANQSPSSQVPDSIYLPDGKPPSSEELPEAEKHEKKKMKTKKVPTGE